MAEMTRAELEAKAEDDRLTETSDYVTTRHWRRDRNGDYAVERTVVVFRDGARRLIAEWPGRDMPATVTTGDA